MSIAFYGAGTPVFDRCETTETSGRTIIRTGHYFQRRQGVWVCANCGAVK